MVGVGGWAGADFNPGKKSGIHIHFFWHQSKPDTIPGKIFRHRKKPEGIACIFSLKYVFCVKFDREETVPVPSRSPPLRSGISPYYLNKDPPQFFFTPDFFIRSLPWEKPATRPLAEPPARRTACPWRQFAGEGGIGGSQIAFLKKNYEKYFPGIFPARFFLAMQRKVSGFF